MRRRSHASLALIFGMLRVEDLTSFGRADESSALHSDLFEQNRSQGSSSSSNRKLIRSDSRQSDVERAAELVTMEAASQAQAASLRKRVVRRVPASLVGRRPIIRKIGVGGAGEEREEHMALARRGDTAPPREDRPAAGDKAKGEPLEMDGSDEIPPREDKNEEGVQSPLEHAEDVPADIRGKNVEDDRGFVAGMMFVNGKGVGLKADNQCMSTDGKSLLMEACYRGDRTMVPERMMWFWDGRRIKNRESGKCIGFPWSENPDELASTAASVVTQLEIQDCRNRIEQNFYFDDFQRLKNEFEGAKCMDTKAGEKLVYMQLCDSRHSQWWAYY